MTKKEKRKEYLFDPILPDIKSWPIHLLTEDRKNVIRQVLKRTKKAILNKSQGNGQLDDIIANAMFLERARIKQNPWKIDPKDEEDFWKEIKEQLLIAANPDLGKKKRDALEEAVLEEIIVRYAEEIAGTFKVKTYNFASDVTPYLLAKLVKASAKRRGTRLFAGPNRKSVYEKIILEGHTAQMRELAKLGTVVLVPTHFSNLDSLVMGWCIQAMGLPAFLYGAGLNLFNTRVLSYFMSKLGAYKLDRRKKNRIYLETLKNYQTIALQRGVHSLFFPGGTRSRSGMIENTLKLGLLGTAMEAQRLNFVDRPEHPEKIFIVPAVINYHFVLEAPQLIDEYLRKVGKERYFVEKDKFSSSYKISRIILKFLTAPTEITVSFGEPMDVFGNRVDEEGNSQDKNGQVIDISKYFMLNGVITANQQRDAQYNQMLGDEIIKQYHRWQVLQPSIICAFTAFKILENRYPKLDLYELLRLPTDDLEIANDEFLDKLEKVKSQAQELNREDKIALSPEMDLPVVEILALGLKHLGSYHAQRPLIRNEEGRITTQSLKNLYYYHNRLVGYDLENAI